MVLLRVGLTGGNEIPPTLESGLVNVTLVTFQRGDVNMDSFVDISDAIYLARHIFVSSINFPVTCRDAADANNDDGNLGLPDIIRILNAFLGVGVVIEPPFGTCGSDTENPDCDFFDPNACP